METNVKQFDPQKCITEEDLADRWGITKGLYKIEDIKEIVLISGDLTVILFCTI